MSFAQRSAAFINQPETMKKRRKPFAKIKPSTIAVYASVFLLVVAIISIGYTQPKDSTTVANAANVSVDSKDKTSVDDTVATSVAASVAETANLSVAKSVANLAISTKIQSQLSQSDGSSASKPQIIESVVESRLVKSYAVVSGDTVNTVAAKFNISAQTVKWANNLTTDAVSVGSTLKILPVDGILYSVEDDDTIDSIVKKYSVDKTRVITYNDLEVSGLQPNTSIILPDGVLPENERPGYVAPVNYNYYSGFGTGFGGATWRISVGTPSGPYAYGNCTLYAYNRRIQLGLPVGTNGGNASTWAEVAATPKDKFVEGLSQLGYGWGLEVDHTPTVGAIMQNSGNLGHVAIVESILPNGDLSVSEMNAYVSGGGYNIVSGRTILSGNVGQYWFIH